MIVAAALVLASSGAVAQQRAERSSVVSLDQEKLYDSTLYGQRLEREFGKAREDLIAEHASVQEELEAEEAELTKKRAEMKPEEFRVLADAFDDKATRIRAEREAKTRALQRREVRSKAEFYNNITPITRLVMRERGASVILDSRAIILSVQDINITDDLIARVDAILGDGERFVVRGRGEALKENADDPEAGEGNIPNGAVRPGMALPLGEPLE